MATATVATGWTVQLDAGAAGPGAWYRATYSGTDVRVSDQPTAVDRMPPLNTPLDYYWVDEGGISPADTVTVESAYPVLSSTMYGSSMQVTVVSQPPLRFEAGSVVHRVIGRRDPIVSVAPAVYPSGTLRLYAPDLPARIAIITLLDKGDNIALRSTCPAAVDDMVIAPRSWEDPLVSESSPAGPRWIDIEYQAVSASPDAYPQRPLWTWADVEAAHATWADVEATYQTWAALEDGP